MPEPVREEWIAAVAGGRTFADVGGLWGTVNEQVTVAAAAGARELTMIDMAPRGGEDDLWAAFEARLAEHDVSDVRLLNGNLDEPSFVEEAGTFDVVHCSGVLYHCPEPLQTLHNLRSMVGETLVLGTATMPETVATSAGTVSAAPGSALLVPAMTDSQRAIFGEWLRENGAPYAYGLNYALRGDWNTTADDWNPYEAWWWFFTRDYVAALLEAAGFTVTNIASYWNGRATFFQASPA